MRELAIPAFRTRARTLGTLCRVVGLIILLLAFLQILMEFFPFGSSFAGLSQDVAAGRTHLVTYFAGNETLTVQWHSHHLLKQYTQDLSLPWQSDAAARVRQLATLSSATGDRLSVRMHDPSAGWGGLAMLFAPVYIHFVSSAALKVAVVVTCCGVLLWIAVGHGAAGDKLLWICACVFTGFGFVAYVVLNPLAKAHRKRQPSVACLDTGGNV